MYTLLSIYIAVLIVFVFGLCLFDKCLFHDFQTTTDFFLIFLYLSHSSPHSMLGNVHNLHKLTQYVRRRIPQYFMYEVPKYTHRCTLVGNNRVMNYLENRKRRYCNTIRNDIFCTHYNTYYYVLRLHMNAEN